MRHVTVDMNRYDRALQKFRKFKFLNFKSGHTGGRAECALDLVIVRLGRVREHGDEENDQNECRGDGASCRGRATHRGFGF